MKKNPKGILCSYPIVTILLFSYITSQAQWTAPDASGNIYNTNSGDVIVKSPATNGGWMLYVNPLGLGGITVGETNTGSGGYTSLTMGISAYQGGYSKIQSIQNAGSAWGILALNPGGGNVLIGKTTQINTSYVLDINGPARANQVTVNATGADYVFDPGYRLSPLKDVEAYVLREHHLPGIAPAAQMQQQGLDLGDNQAKLLAKIEELTLYLIQQDKDKKAMEEKIESLERRVKQLEHGG